MAREDGSALAGAAAGSPPRLRPAQASSKMCLNPRPCRFGDDCMYAHSVREASAFLATQARRGGARPPGRPLPAPGDLASPLYKTKLCMHWGRAAGCSRGALCAFAHGEVELRPRPPSKLGFSRSGSAPHALALRSIGSSDSDASSAASSSSSAPAAAPAAAEEAAGAWARAAARGGPKQEAAAVVAAWADDEALALQLQFDEHQRLAEEAWAQAQAQAARAGSDCAADEPPPAAACVPLVAEGAPDACHGGREHAVEASAGSLPSTACSSEASLRPASSQDVASNGGASSAAEDGEAASGPGGVDDGADDAVPAEPAAVPPLSLQAGQAAQQAQWVQWQNAFGQTALMWRMHPALAPYGSPTATACYAYPNPFHEPHAGQHQQQQASGRSSAEGCCLGPAAPGGAAAAPSRGRSLLQRSITAGMVDPLSLLPAFMCPLTRRPFVNPVVAADGITYEQEVLADWLARHGGEASPVTGQPLGHQGLAPNAALQAAMGEVAELVRELLGP